MTVYVAMIRGVGPENPNMRGAKLSWAFEQLGFTNVRAFLTSGNVLFESPETDRTKLEATVEAALPRLLDFEREVFIRSKAALQALVDDNPFGDLQHANSGTTYLTVTFFKQTPEIGFTLPYQPDGKAYRLLSLHEDALCSVVDLTKGKTPDLMAWLERRFGKQLTTRTYNTVTRLCNKLQ
ncbi:MAG TPA: DUF1697 domain-containing protein [Candidatus Saccharimonadales bacterium]|nr:DUF1697 domain-containing protein [Candidatus Saccharimonadales bacterium]